MQPVKTKSELLLLLLFVQFSRRLYKQRHRSMRTTAATAAVVAVSAVAVVCGSDDGTGDVAAPIRTSSNLTK